MLVHRLKSWPNIKTKFGQCLNDIVKMLIIIIAASANALLILRNDYEIPANTGNWPNAGSMLVHHFQRWPNIEPALCDCLVLDGTHR